MCCYHEFKNFEHLNNIVQVIINKAIQCIQSLAQKEKVPEEKTPKKTNEDLNVEKKDESAKLTEECKDSCDNAKTDESTEKKGEANEEVQAEDSSSKESKKEEKEIQDADNVVTKPSSPEESEEVWTLEDKDRLFQFLGKVFLTNFPLYVAYKLNAHKTLEDLSQQEANALGSYCELAVSFSFP